MAEPFIGQVKIFAGNFAPQGWAFCEGQLLAISSHDALFSLLGTNYGGDGRTTFGLPDLRGRCAVGTDGSDVGTNYGSPTFNLNSANLPPHTHSIGEIDMDIVADDGPNTTPGGRYLSNTDPETYTDSTNTTMPLDTGNTGSTGNSTAISHRQPYLGISYIIALVGIYPSSF
ncbi:MAG: phage tail protein [Akkermansiaceae bacterium]